MPNITTIVHISVPETNAQEVLANWRTIEAAMLKQPGVLNGIFYRCVDKDSPYQFVNVAKWESAAALERALGAMREDLKGRGFDVTQVWERLGVRVSQNNYVEEVQY